MFQKNLFHDNTSLLEEKLCFRLTQVLSQQDIVLLGKYETLFWKNIS